MSNNFKPLSEQVAKKLIAQFEEGTSVFQQGEKPLQMPFNPTTDKNYRGVAALILMTEKRDDPRWMSMDNANFKGWVVNKGEKGTLISFYRTSEMKPVMKNGKPVLKENEKPQMEKVKLDKSELTTVFLWNGEQLGKIPVLEPQQPALSADRRTAAIIRNSESNATSLIDLASAFVAEKPSGSGIKDALVANMAELFVSATLNQPFDLGDHVGYIASWSQLIKEQPAELFKAANDAQFIADKILALEKKKEQQISSVLNKGDEISYKGNTFKIMDNLKGKTVQVENAEGKKFKVGPNDKLYTSLLEAKNNPEKQQSREPATTEKEEQNMEQGYAMSM